MKEKDIPSVEGLLTKNAKIAVDKMLSGKEYDFIRIISNIREALHDIVEYETLFDQEDEYDEENTGVSFWHLPPSMQDRYSDIESRNARRQYVLQQTISLFDMFDLINK